MGGFFFQILQNVLTEVDELKSVGLFLFLDCSSIFSFINLQYSNKYLGGSQYCSLLKETVACNRLCQREVMGICEEFGSFNEMRLDSGVCFHICNDSSIGLPQSHTHLHPHTHHTSRIELIIPPWMDNVVIPSAVQCIHGLHLFKRLLEKYKLGVFGIAFTSRSHRLSEYSCLSWMKKTNVSGSLQEVTKLAASMHEPYIYISETPFPFGLVTKTIRSSL